MQTSAIIDVAIGLVFIYVLLSLMVSIVNESITRLTAQRATMLKAWLEQALGSNTAQCFYNHVLVKGIERKSPKSAKYTLPSYVASKTFALALLDLVLPSKNGNVDAVNTLIDHIQNGDAKPQQDGKKQVPIDQVAKDIVINFLRHTDGDLEKTRLEIAEWFDQSMERLSGWYKRRIQVYTLIIGVIVALAANTDTIYISQTLWHDKDLREAILPEAIAFVKKVLPSTDDLKGLIDGLQQEFNAINFPLFWDKDAFALLKSLNLFDILSKLLGIILTAVALSFGARFWFDLLKKLVNIRLTGQPPDKIDLAEAK